MTKILIIAILIISNIKADFNLTNMITTIKNSVTSTSKSPQEIEKERIIEAKNIKDAHFNNLWSDVFDDLQELLALEDKYVRVPQSSYLGDDKKSVREDIDKAIANIYQTLIEDDILSYKKKINELNEKIATLIKDKKYYIEQKITAPLKSIIETTKSGYDEKIKDTNEEIIAHKKSIEDIKNGLQKSFATDGIILSADEINIMLSKVYGDDIIQMSVVIGLLNQITEQLMTLMKESNEELSYAKKYYGLFMVTLQVVVYTQQQYIDKVAHNFIPKIKNIIISSKSKVDKTTLLYQEEQDKNRKKIYKQNIQTQKFTIEVARLYLKELVELQSKLIQGQNITKENLKLAKNTYETVSLSANLSNIMSDNKNIFNAVMKIQMPELIPFENKDIQNKYIELTNKMIRE